MNYGLASTGATPVLGIPAVIVAAQQGLALLVIVFALITLLSLLPRRAKQIQA